LNHPGFGIVKNEQRLNVAMRTSYHDLFLVAAAIGNSADVKSAEIKLKKIQERPIGDRPRLVTESIYRNQIRDWIDSAKHYGLRIIELEPSYIATHF